MVYGGGCSGNNNGGERTRAAQGGRETRVDSKCKLHGMGNESDFLRRRLAL